MTNRLTLGQEYCLGLSDGAQCNHMSPEQKRKAGGQKEKYSDGKGIKETEMRYATWDRLKDPILAEREKGTTSQTLQTASRSWELSSAKSQQRRTDLSPINQGLQWYRQVRGPLRTGQTAGAEWWVDKRAKLHLCLKPLPSLHYHMSSTKVRSAAA